MNLGVLVSGRGSNLQAILDACRDGRLTSRVALVLSDVADAQALDHARRAGVVALHLAPGSSRARLGPEGARAYVAELRGHHVELVLLAGFMRIIGRTFFEAYPNRILNIHPSLLPTFRGLDAQRQALEAGVKTAGCTVHIVVPEVDSGPILLQAEVPVEAGDTVESLSARILKEEHRIYVEVIAKVERGEIDLDAAVSSAGQSRFGSGSGPAFLFGRHEDARQGDDR